MHIKIHLNSLPMFGFLIVLTVSLLVTFKVEINNMPTCSVFINSCSLTDTPNTLFTEDCMLCKVHIRIYDDQANAKKCS